MKSLMQNEKGLTLVEILAALVILGIVLVSVMSFFTQSAKFTASNHDKLTAVQVGEEVVSIVRDINSIDELVNDKKIFEFKVGEGKNAIISKTKYPNYIVEIKKITEPLVASKLQKVEIVVLSNEKAPKSKFATEMYYEAN